MAWELSEDGKYIVTDMKVHVPGEPGAGWFTLGTMGEGGIQTVPDTEETITWSTLHTDIIDKIDDVLTPPSRCPHCGKDWHPGPLTKRVQAMLDEHRFDPDYDPTTDESHIVCVGAEYHGPNRPREYTWATGTYLDTTTWTFVLGGKEPNYVKQAYTSIQSTWSTLTTMLWSDAWKPMGYLGQSNGYFQILPPKPEPCDMPHQLPDVEFGPQNWIPPTEPIKAPKPVKELVWAYWDDITRPDNHIPERPGLDFSQYATDEVSYPNNGKAWK